MAKDRLNTRLERYGIPYQMNTGGRHLSANSKILCLAGMAKDAHARHAVNGGVNLYLCGCCFLNSSLNSCA